MLSFSNFSVIFQNKLRWQSQTIYFKKLSSLFYIVPLTHDTSLVNNQVIHSNVKRLMIMLEVEDVVGFKLQYLKIMTSV